MTRNALNLLVRFALLCNFPLLISLDALVMNTINKLFYHSVFVPFIKYPRNDSFTKDTVVVNLTRRIELNFYSIL